jgi:hypothetical protein
MNRLPAREQNDMMKDNQEKLKQPAAKQDAKDSKEAARAAEQSVEAGRKAK